MRAERENGGIGSGVRRVQRMRIETTARRVGRGAKSPAGRDETGSKGGVGPKSKRQEDARAGTASGKFAGRVHQRMELTLRAITSHDRLKVPPAPVNSILWWLGGVVMMLTRR